MSSASEDIGDKLVVLYGQAKHSKPARSLEAAIRNQMGQHSARRKADSASAGVSLPLSPPPRVDARNARPIVGLLSRKGVSLPLSPPPIAGPKH